MLAFCGMASAEVAYDYFLAAGTFFLILQGVFHRCSLLYVFYPDGRLDWRTHQTLVRSMPDLHKTLIVANVREIEHADDDLSRQYAVDELAMATEHAPFRHKISSKGVGSQLKK